MRNVSGLSLYSVYRLWLDLLEERGRFIYLLLINKLLVFAVSGSKLTQGQRYDLSEIVGFYEQHRHDLRVRQLIEALGQWYDFRQKKQFMSLYGNPMIEILLGHDDLLNFADKSLRLGLTQSVLKQRSMWLAPESHLGLIQIWIEKLPFVSQRKFVRANGEFRKVFTHQFFMYQKFLKAVRRNKHAALMTLWPKLPGSTLTTFLNHMEFFNSLVEQWESFLSVECGTVVHDPVRVISESDAQKSIVASCDVGAEQNSIRASVVPASLLPKKEASLTFKAPHAVSPTRSEKSKTTTHRRVIYNPRGKKQSGSQKQVPSHSEAMPKLTPVDNQNEAMNPASRVEPVRQFRASGP